MKTAVTLTCCMLLCSGVASGQITQITAGALISPQVLDFDTANAATPPPGGVVSPNDPYFAGFGLCDINIVNAPGMHNPAGDTLSSGFMGNCIISLNNTLAIGVPGAPMDNHTLGAGWSFRLDPGLIATQFGALIVDQTNHMMAVETWSGGVLQNTFTFTMSGGFPNPYIYFEDLAGFDEVRFQNVTTAGGWGIDDFTLGNVQGAVTGLSCPPLGAYQVNSSEASMTISGLPDPGPFAPITKSAGVNAAETLDLSSTNSGAPWDVAIHVGATTVPNGFLTPGNQILNLNFGVPGWSFLNGGAWANLTTTSFPAAPFQIPFTATTPVIVAGQFIVADPINPDGWVLSHAVDYSAEACNATQSFDNLPTGAGIAPIAWTNPVSGNAWSVWTGGTSSTGTGPTSAFSGANYMYCETSVAGGTSFVMDTCPVDLTLITGVTGTLTFQLSRIGATIGTLELFVDDQSGAGFVPITDATSGTPVTFVGADPAQAQGGTEWTQQTVPFLHDIVGSSAAIRFQYTSGTSFTGDIGIDDFAVQ